jgi:RNA polymerase sigma-70 factor (ECF subfamily)
MFPSLPGGFIRLPVNITILPIDQSHTSRGYSSTPIPGTSNGPGRNRRRHLNGMDLMTEFVRLLESEIPRLRRYARALTRDPSRADDLVQSSLVRAIAKQHLWQPGTDLRAWLFTILHNLHVNDVRRGTREGVVVPVEEIASALTVDANAGASLELRDLERAMACLPDEQRQVILLVGLEGMRYEEVAAILGIPIGTVRSRLSRGRETLRGLMGMDEKTTGASAARGTAGPQRSARHDLRPPYSRTAAFARRSAPGTAERARGTGEVVGSY